MSFGFLSPEWIRNETLVMVTLVSNGASKNCRIVLAIALLESASWLLGVEFDHPGDFWQVENPPADWRVSKAFRTTRYRDVRPGVQTLSLQGCHSSIGAKRLPGRLVEMCALASLSETGSSGSVSLRPDLAIRPTSPMCQRRRELVR